MKQVADLKNLISRLDWRHRVIILISLAGLIAFFLGPRWVLSRHSTELSMEALERGVALVKTLALTNQQAVALKQDTAYDVETILAERGVLDATLTDATGHILAPISRAGTQSIPSPVVDGGEGLQVREVSQGLYELSYPMERWEVTVSEAQRHRIGTATLHFSTKKVLKLLKATHFQYYKFLAFVALVLGLSLYKVLAITERPLEDLNMGLQDCLKGESREVSLPRNFTTLSEIATGINRLLRRVEEKSQHPPSSPDGDGLVTTLTQAVGKISREPIFLFDRDNKLLYQNEASERLLGGPVKEILGVHLVDIINRLEKGLQPTVVELKSGGESSWSLMTVGVIDIGEAKS